MHFWRESWHVLNVSWSVFRLLGTSLTVWVIRLQTRLRCPQFQDCQRNSRNSSSAPVSIGFRIDLNCWYVRPYRLGSPPLEPSITFNPARIRVLSARIRYHAEIFENGRQQHSCRTDIPVFILFSDSMFVFVLQLGSSFVQSTEFSSWTKAARLTQENGEVIRL